MSKSETPPELAEAIEEFNRLLMDVPEVADILARVRSGELGEAEAMQALADLYSNSPKLSSNILDLAKTAMVPLQTGNLTLPDPEEVGGNLIYTGVGGLKINPLAEAALAERLQFDGDIPEQRTGPLPPGADPAVSVQTQARNPVMVGEMLSQASGQVRREVDQHEDERRKLIEGIAGGDTTTEALVKAGVTALTKDGDPDFAIMIHGSAKTDHPSYQRGQVPAPVEAPQVSGSAIIKMSPEERREAAWKFLSTTQGRRTAATTITDLVVKDINRRLERRQMNGSSAVGREYVGKQDAPILAMHEWSLNLSRGNQPAFSMVDVAAKAITQEVLKQLGEQLPAVLYVEVIPINEIDQRTVGWACRVCGVK